MEVWPEAVVSSLGESGLMDLIKRSLIFLTFLPLVLGIVLLFFPAPDETGSAFASARVSDPEDLDTIEPERLIFLLQYVGTDYGVAVEDGQIVSEFEYQEMLDFTGVLIEQYQLLSSSSELLGELKQLGSLVREKREWKEVQEVTRRLVPRISEELNVLSYPTIAPNLERGKVLYERDCLKCHGVEGKGDGPSAAESDPPPRSFYGPRMNQLAPYQIYNAVSFGVEGTDMPSHLESLHDQERWDVAFYVLTFRQDFRPTAPATPFPFSLRDLAVQTNDELVSQLAGEGIVAEIAHLDHYRQNPPGASLEDLLGVAGQQLDQSLDAYHGGEVNRALRLTLDAYLGGVEPAEPTLRQIDYALVTELEGAFFSYRTALRTSTASDITAAHEEVRELTRRAEQALQHTEASSGFAFLQSLTIILREGVEAALLLGVMVTYLAAAGYRKLQRYVVVGAGLGVLLGIVTWGIAEFVLEMSPLQREALEGITSLLAAAVLFSVSFWIIHQIDIRHWKEYIRKKAEKAMGTGSGVALASAAFLAVYREALETVLFYEALWIGNQGAHDAILAGFVTGSVVLVLLVFFMFRFGLRIPLKQFFAVTGVLLGLLAFVFAGYGIRELQAIGWIKETPLSWMVRFPLLEIRPTLESSALQFGILLSFLIGWFQLNRLTSVSVKSR